MWNLKQHCRRSSKNVLSYFIIKQSIIWYIEFNTLLLKVNIEK